MTTLNEELQNRNTGLSQTNDDLNNLLSSVDIAIVMLGRDLRIRQFTPVAGRILNLIPSDVGRPITDLRSGVKVTDIAEMIREVLANASVLERDVTDGEDTRYRMSVRPYRTSDDRIDGAVVTLVDSRKTA